MTQEITEKLKKYVDIINDTLANLSAGNIARVGALLEDARLERKTVFIGFNGGKPKDLVDIPIVAPIHDMEQAEDIHLILGHFITACFRGNA